MKQFANILILIIFLAFSAGYVISKQYCGGEWVNTEFVYPGSHNACCDGDDMDDNCCRNEIKIIKIDSDYLSISYNFDNTTSEIAFTLPAYFSNIKETDLNSSDYLNYKPPLINRSGSIQLQSFLF